MMFRNLVFLAMLSLPALAQIQVFQFDGAKETLAGALVDVGSAAPGDELETLFHVRNMGTGPVALQKLSLSGEGFRISAAPSLPYTIGPGAFAEFRVAFTPVVTGMHSAFLLVNTISTTLQGTSILAASVLLTGSKTPLIAGAVIDFGSVQRGSSLTQSFTLSNFGNVAVTVTTLGVTGTMFRGPIGLNAPVQLAPGQTASFQVAFEPQTGQPAKGTLTVDKRSFNLTGLGLEIQVFQFDGAKETLAGALVDLGSATPGDTLETRFRVRNNGAGAVALQTLSMSGEGFKISAAPSLPTTIAPGAFAEFRVAFAPSVTGLLSAFLLVNTVNLESGIRTFLPYITLRGTSVPAASVLLAASKTPLVAGAVIDFGSVQRGNSRLQSFTLFNSGNAAITVNALAVRGAMFRGPIGQETPTQLAPGQTASFQVAFEPQTGQPAQGTLTVDNRSFTLMGLGLDPPLPTASIVLSSSAGASGQQNSISIPLASASQVSGTATLTMEFRSGVAGIADDAAVQFLPAPKRAATATIAVGDTMAKFGSQSSLIFQTGTTAGTIVFTLKIANATQQSTLTIPPESVNIETAHGVRRVNDLDVSIIGFDNTYSASQLSFTFFDRSGVTMQPGVIRVDATPDFKHYFNASSVGGMFALLATFPVSGDATQVGGVEIQLTNSSGITKSQRIAF